MMNTKIIKEHHTRANLCKTRPNYRQGRKLTAIKGYTINNESQHLFIYGVPQINLRSELKSLCLKFGKVLNLHVIVDHETEIFTECFHVQYERITSARIAKRLLDDRSFYGGILHVCYAPEFESLNETRQKLFQRCKDVLKRIPNYNLDGEQMQYYQNYTNKPQKQNLILKDTDFYADDPIISNIKYNETVILKDTDFYADDPIISNIKQIKYNETIYNDGQQSDIQNISKNNKPCTKKWENSKYSQPVAATQHMIPIQVLKYKFPVKKSEKKIVFHNKAFKP